ncbi:hypothetical protein GOV13_01745 [Candidatus Pacearchaeota archaeon]|nr:hypothetical protein [Candidatus Pacearchaeota archaeon]
MTNRHDRPGGTLVRKHVASKEQFFSEEETLSILRDHDEEGFFNLGDKRQQITTVRYLDRHSTLDLTWEEYIEADKPIGFDMILRPRYK